MKADQRVGAPKYLKLAAAGFGPLLNLHIYNGQEYMNIY